MASKKTIIGAIVIIGILVIAAIPLFLTVQGVNINSSFELTSISGSSSLSTSAAQPGFGIANTNVEVNERTMNYYEYMGVKANNYTTTSQTEVTGDAIVDILIKLNLTTPSNKTIYHIFDPHDLQGSGRKNVAITYGPDELGNLTGTFHLELTISISVTPPTFDNPIFEKDIVVQRDFEVQ